MSVEETIVAAIKKLSRVLRFLHQDVGRKHGLTPLQVEIVNYVHTSSEEYSGIAHIARELDLTKPTVSDAVSTLERKHLVIKQRHVSDKRRSVIRTTKKGSELAAELQNWDNALQVQIERFSSPEKLSTKFFLLKLIAALQEAGTISFVRLCLTCSNLIRTSGSGTDDFLFCEFLGKPISDKELRINCNGFL